VIKINVLFILFGCNASRFAGLHFCIAAQSYRHKIKLLEFYVNNYMPVREQTGALGRPFKNALQNKELICSACPCSEKRKQPAP
jgi:hypothetical protein